MSRSLAGEAEGGQRGVDERRCEGVLGVAQWGTTVVETHPTLEEIPRSREQCTEAWEIGSTGLLSRSR